MEYLVQKGDTIAKVKQLFKTDWETIRRLNPHAVGRSKRTGNWFLKEGALVRSFDDLLREKQAINEQPHPAGKAHEIDQWKEYTIKPGDTLWALAVKKFRINVEDIIKDNGIKNPKTIRPGQKIRIRQQDLPEPQEVVASWYGKSYHGRIMANGNQFNMYADTIAHKSLPFGTRVALKNLKTGQRVEATVTDRGPYVKGRDVDVSYGLAKKLDLVKQGVGKLMMQVLG